MPQTLTVVLLLALAVLVSVLAWRVLLVALDPYRATEVADLPALRESLVKWEKYRTDSLAGGLGHQAKGEWERVQQIRKAIRRHERTLAKQGKAAAEGGACE